MTHIHLQIAFKVFLLIWIFIYIQEIFIKKIWRKKNKYWKILFLKPSVIYLTQFATIKSLFIKYQSYKTLLTVSWYKTSFIVL